MSRNVQVASGHNNVIIEGTEYDAGANVIVTDATFSALTDAGRFTDGTLTDLGAVEPGDDLVSVQGSFVAAPAALTTTTIAAVTAANAAGGTPTAAEHNALVADVTALRTKQAALLADITALRSTVSSLLAALAGVGKPMAPS
jgi:hypothetical protein